MDRIDMKSHVGIDMLNFKPFDDRACIESLSALIIGPDLSLFFDGASDGESIW